MTTTPGFRYMARYRRIPHNVEAEQFRVGKKPWPKGVTKTENDNCWGNRNGKRTKYLLDVNDGSLLSIAPGDYIITHPDGKRYYREAKDFEAEYELLERGKNNG